MTRKPKYKYKLIKEYKKFISNKYDFRLYIREECNEDGEECKTRWCFGFPKGMFGPLYNLLIMSPYWAEAHCYEDGDFWVWWTMNLTDSDKLDKDILKNLESDLSFYLRQYNMVVNFYLKEG